MTRLRTVNYLERDRREGNDDIGPRRLVDVGFWWPCPRLIPLCRLLGHRPVVDGTPDTRTRTGARWVCCDRCGVRRDPQGSLSADAWSIGDRYDGPVGSERWSEANEVEQARRALAGRRPGPHPGPWPTAPTGEFGGQLVIGAAHVSYGVEVKVGNPSSENALGGHVNLGRLGALYLHTGSHGTWVQRLLNPTGYESKVTGWSLHDGLLSWNVWADRDRWSRDTPRWRHGMTRVNPLDRLLGQKRYSYDDAAGPVDVTVRMPHGDDHVVTVTLQREARGRARQWWRPARAWSAHWEAPSAAGIPTKPGDRGRVTASAVKVSSTSAAQGTWPEEAAAGIAKRLTRDRSRYGYPDRRRDLIPAGVDGA